MANVSISAGHSLKFKRKRQTSVNKKTESQTTQEVRKFSLKTMLDALRASKNQIKPIKTEEQYIFANQLATLLDAGVPLMTALSVLSEQTDSKDFKKIGATAVQDINAGATLTEALSRYKGAFSSLFISMVHVGEIGGEMVTVLKQLSSYLKTQDDLAKKVKSASSYPKFVFSFFFLVLIGIVFGLIPKFKETFAGFGAELPLPTRILVSISEKAKDNLPLEVGLIVILVFLFKKFKKTESGRYYLDNFMLKLPVAGEMIAKVALSRFCRTLSVLMKSGVQVVDSLEIAGSTAENTVFNQAFKRLRTGVMEGATLNTLLSKEAIFPSMMVQMISVGEQSGSIDIMLIKIADMYDAQLNTTVDGLSSIIEPILMIGLGAVALVVIIALYLPIFQMGSIMH